MKRLATLFVLLLCFALSSPTWGAPQFTQRGEIVLAEYGYGNRWTDVSQRVASLARGDVLRFRVDDATLGVSSTPGAQNSLRILVLTPASQVRWLTFRENQDVNLRGYTFSTASAGELRIVRATYGTSVRSNDVTNRLISQIRDNRISMQVNNTTMGGDPDHDRPKVLTVVYSVDGREDRVSVAEFGQLDLPRDTSDDRYGLRIIHATYGTNVRSNDVTDRLSAQIRDGRISMDVNNTTMGGDPDHDRPKTLTVTYSMDGREDRVSVAEFGHLDLPRDTAAGYDLRIIRATYGTTVRSNDVTNRLNSQIRDGKLSMQVNNTTMGGDPDRDRPKTLTVTYSVAGREDRLSVAEFGYLNLPRDTVGSRNELRIIRATYGTTVRSNDVTNRLNSQIRDNQLSMEVNNTTMGGDPDHDRPKTLTVTYSIDGREDRISVAEFGYLRLPRDTGGNYSSDLRIIRATYGTSVRSNDVTKRLIAQIRDGQISMLVNNTTMGGDPDRDRPKTLTVTFSVDGREDRISVAEGSYLNLPGDSYSSASRLISSGTQLSIRTNEAIDSKTAREGQRFSAVMEQDVLDNTGALAVPKGSDVELVIRNTEGSELVLDIDSIIVSGRRYSVSTEDLARKGREGIGANKRTATMVGGGAVIGAIIGAIVGGGKGAAIGAAIGAAGGAGAQVMTKGKDVNVPSETVLNFRLEQDLYLVPQP